MKERLYRFRSFWILPSIAFVLLPVAFRSEPHRSAVALFWLMPVGVVIWTMLEYGLHRYVFHIQLPLRNPRLREFVNGSHLSHHASPRDRDKVLVRPTYGLVVSAVLFGLLYRLTGSVVSGAGIIAGVWAGFLYYEAVHYRVHFSQSGSGFVARQRRTHFHHHFTNNRQCFGVTSPLWDYVFGTNLRRLNPTK
jgi:sterol desaturase/sphingolipid hydroxylase (fatty acid hydroxylase superfamily)